MSNTMLDHQKMVLKAVSSNPVLFEKELIKSLNWLNSHEVRELKIWIIKNFDQEKTDILNRTFMKNKIKILS